jgi:DNA-binding HxlR family transcriptional regulator
MTTKISNGFQIVHDLIKLKWVPEILTAIETGKNRYTELLDGIEYISHTELNRKLSILVDKEVISKSTDGRNTNYRLLPFGEDLVHIFHHLENLEERYFQP